VARVQATLSAELQAIVPTFSSGSAAVAAAYGDYMLGATALTPIIAAAVPAAVSAMAAAMTFTAGATAAAGAAVLSAGVSAFWAAMVAAPATYFALFPIITIPPALAGLTAALTPIMVANAAPGVSLVTASDALAAALHTASTGGTTTTPVAVVTPIL